MSLGIALDTDIAVPRQLGQHRGHGHAALTSSIPAWRSVGRTSPLRGRPRLRLGCLGRRRTVRFCWLLMSLDRGAVTRDVSDQAICASVPDPALRAAWMAGRSRRRRRRRAKMSTRLAPCRHAASHTNGAVSYRPTASRSADWWLEKVDTAFATKAQCQRRAFRWRAAGKPLQAGQQHLDPRHSQDADQLLVVSAQRAARRILDPGQKFSLECDPVCR